MKFTVTFITLLSLSSVWGIKVNKNADEKGKRETGVSYPSSGHSTHSFQAPALGHDDGNSISIGAGYSVGGAKPSYSYGGPDAATFQVVPEGQAPSGHSSIQLAPITLQPSHGGLVGSDLSQLMSQISQGLNSGAISLDGLYQGGYPAQNSYSGSFGGSDGQQGYTQEFSIPQINQGPQKYQQYPVPNQPLPSPPSYSAGTKGLGSYSSTGPVLFSPNEPQSHQQNVNVGLPSATHGFNEAVSFIGGVGHSMSGLSIGGPHSGPAQPSVSFGNSYAPSHGGHVSPYKNLQSGYLVGSKASFKPSVYLGSGPSNSVHGLSSSFRGGQTFSAPLSGSGYGGLSLSSSGHSPTFHFGGSSAKFGAPSFVPAKYEGNGFDSGPNVASLSPNGHFSSPPGTTYGIPSSGAYSSGPVSHIAHSASSINPNFYSSLSKGQSFGEGSSSFKGPLSGLGSFNSFASGPKYSSPSSHYAPPKDIQGSYSDNVYTYNTIKYSEDLKPKSN